MSRRDRDDDARRPLSLSQEQAARFQAMTPAERLRDPEWQSWVRSHRTHASLSEQGKATAARRGHDALSEAGRLGWQATVARYGEDFAFDKAAATRKARPTSLERDLIALLAALGQHEDAHYQREYKVVGRTYADFAWPPQRRIVEAFGPCHFFGWTPEGEFSDKDAARIGRLEAAGWSVTVVTMSDLAPAHRAATLTRLRAYLDLPATPAPASGQPESGRRWLSGTRAALDGWRERKARRQTWRYASQ